MKTIRNLTIKELMFLDLAWDSFQFYFHRRFYCIYDVKNRCYKLAIFEEVDYKKEIFNDTFKSIQQLKKHLEKILDDEE